MGLGVDLAPVGLQKLAQVHLVRDEDLPNVAMRIKVAA